ncbi:MAG: hypothetical protein Q8R72_07425 [Hylemonella sp.]|nr:hypothetical protein [Hylemonella sp.]
MKTTWHQAAGMGSLRLLVSLAAALALLTGCPSPSVPRSGALETPVFSVLEIPQVNGGWTTYSSAAPMEVLPTRGRNLRVWFSAPLGSTFSVGLREPDGTLTALPQSQGAPVPAEQGFFQVISVNAAVTPPLYTVQLRSPLAMTSPAIFNVEVVNKTLRTDVSDSAPMVVRLAQVKVFTVTVAVSGNGHVTSNPPGIECGTSPQGRPLTQCSHNFGRGQVTLNPGSNDLNTTRFDGWSGNCAGQSCQFTLDGTAPVQAVATFKARSQPPSASVCQAAPLIAGLRWIATPQCDPASFPTTSSALCDSAGLFCCKSVPVGSGLPPVPSARCGADKIEFPPDCRNTLGRGRLLQPGGCYE